MFGERAGAVKLGGAKRFREVSRKGVVDGVRGHHDRRRRKVEGVVG